IISERPRTNEIDGMIRQIVPPIYGKFFGHKNWRHLWHVAHQALIEAEVLVVIGCSLVESDYHLRGMLGNAIKQRRQRGKPFQRVIVVDRATRTRRRWMRLIGGQVSAKEQIGTFLEFAHKYL